jgi:DNA transposition AAA+ family ATPase
MTTKQPTDIVIAETSVFKKIHAYTANMQRYPRGIHSIVVNASMGKSVAITSYTENQPNSYYIRCHRFMGVRLLFKEILKAMGKDIAGSTIELLNSIVRYAELDNNPVLLIDEVDKLRDEVLEMFIDLENKLHGKCGLVFLATPYMRKRMENGVARNKRGFAELYSRMRKILWDINPSKAEFKKDVELICYANGINDVGVIAEMHNKCENDFRVLTDLIIAYKNKKQK